MTFDDFFFFFFVYMAEQGMLDDLMEKYESDRE